MRSRLGVLSAAAVEVAVLWIDPDLLSRRDHRWLDDPEIELDW